MRGTDLGYTDPMVDLDPRLRIHALLKNDDSTADITVENARLIEQGKKAEIKDYELKFNWGPKMLRNLKFGGMMARLWKMGLISKFNKSLYLTLHLFNNFVWIFVSYSFFLTRLYCLYYRILRCYYRLDPHHG